MPGLTLNLTTISLWPRGTSRRSQTPAETAFSLELTITLVALSALLLAVVYDEGFYNRVLHLSILV
eukprot:11463926-Karenia_brevis.AAC.1